MLISEEMIAYFCPVSITKNNQTDSIGHEEHSIGCKPVRKAPLWYGPKSGVQNQDFLLESLRVITIANIEENNEVVLHNAQITDYPKKSLILLRGLPKMKSEHLIKEINQLS